jgi:uncharacterized protein (DUF697 family)
MTIAEIAGALIAVCVLVAIRLAFAKINQIMFGDEKGESK